MPLSQSLTKALNEQIGRELFASATYLQLSNLARSLGCRAVCEYWSKSSEEEHSHARGIVAYLSQRGALASIPAVTPPLEATDIRSAAESVLGLEEQVTAALTRIRQSADSEGDVLTFEFVSGYLAEQIAGEDEARQLLSFFGAAGDLVTFDQQVKEHLAG